MQVETGKFLSGEPYTDFLVGQGGESFHARLAGKELQIGWMSEPGTTGFRLRQVQQQAGGRGSFTQISGKASDNLEALVKQGKFNPDKVGEGLGRILGGKWEVKVTNEKGVYHITATRTGIRNGHE
jgi:hypothetical protein